MTDILPTAHTSKEVDVSMQQCLDLHLADGRTNRWGRHQP
jgi:hypothetical protein